MAEERQGSRELDLGKVFPWVRIFRTFLVALDPFKLLIAALGILATGIGWWLISVVIWGLWAEPKREDFAPAPDAPEQVRSEQDAKYAQAVSRYLFMFEMASPGGRYRVMPWLEDRGPNPWSFVKTVVADNPTKRSEALDSFTKNQMPNLVEPLRKFLSPVIGMFDSRGSFWTRLYCLLILLWFLIVWAFVGGVITRMAILQLSGKEGGGLRESIRFVSSRYMSYFFSPIVPIGLILAIVLCCILFGFFHLVPLIGDIFVDGLFWWLPLAAGFVIALLLVGLVGYPLMYTTLSAEGSDTFDALSRSYNYVYESPWSYIWYAFVSILYGAVLIFFVVFMSSLMIYMAKWGVNQTPWTESTNRETQYLFIYSPTSFGWREVLTSGSPVAVNQTGEFLNPIAAEEYMKTYRWFEHAGAGMVSFWLTLVFLMMLGFGYSYFWTASSMIYLLMRKKVDETEMDEVYVEEEEPEEPIAPVKQPITPPNSQPNQQMVESPTLRVATPPPVTQPMPVVKSESEETPPSPAPTSTTETTGSSAPTSTSTSSSEKVEEKKEDDKTEPPTKP